MKLGKFSNCSIAAVGALVLTSAAFGQQSTSPTEDEKAQLNAAWEEARANREAEEAVRTERSPPDDPYKWTRALTIPGPGGWEAISFTNKGAEAYYGTRRHATRNGAIATVWLRMEFREKNIALGHQSVAAFVEFDCAKNTLRYLSNTGFSKGDLSGETTSEGEDKTSTPILPGTIGDSWLDWACKVTLPKPQPKPRAAEQSPPRN